jgi:non-specific serine/threonine protein kinase
VSSPPTIRFDRFELQPAERRLLRDGDELPLGRRAFDLLVVLVENAGRLVGRDELLDRVWRGVVVEPNNIATQVTALRKALPAELIVAVPGVGYRFTGEVTGGVPHAAVSAAPAVAPQTGALPLTRPLVARDADLAALQSLLGRPGCVTLVGPAGVGKTSLAQQLAAQWAGGPVRWLEMGALHNEAELASALDRAVAAGAADGPGAALQAAFGTAAGLLVLDNAEHLIDEVAALVRRLLAAAVASAPALRLLVTSQRPLAVAGERLLRLAPLALAESADSDSQAWHRGALALFAERYRNASGGATLPPDSLPAVREICAGLDGLPLALEMAAARAALLGVAPVRDGLAERFDMLRQRQRDAPERHRTLVSALHWSHELLDGPERGLFRALGLFRDGFSAELALAVAPPAPGQTRWDVLDCLQALIERSLVVCEPGEPPRYRLLETLRLYARERLAEAEAPARAAAWRGALDAMGRLAATAAARASATSDDSRAALLAEMGNLADVLAWARQHDMPAAVRLACDAARACTFTTWRPEAARLLATLEAETVQLDAALQSLWWRSHAAHLLFSGSADALPAARHAAMLARRAGETLDLFYALTAWARAADVEADAAELNPVLAEMEALLAAHPAWPVTTHIAGLGTLASVAHRRGELETALRHHEHALRLARAGDLTADAEVQENNHAALLVQLGRAAEALQRVDEHLRTASPGVNRLYIGMTRLRALLELGRVAEAGADFPALWAEAGERSLAHEMAVLAPRLALQQGRPRAGALLLGHLQQRAANTGRPWYRNDHLRIEALLAAALPAEEAAALVERGRGLDAGAAERLLFDGADAGGAAA